MKEGRTSRSTRFKAKALARWRWLSARGVGSAEAAEEIGVAEAELRAWSAGEGATPLLVPVEIESRAGTGRKGDLVAVLAGGVRVEGLTLDDVVELARRLS